MRTTLGKASLILRADTNILYTALNSARAINTKTGSDLNDPVRTYEASSVSEGRKPHWKIFCA